MKKSLQKLFRKSVFLFSAFLFFSCGFNEYKEESVNEEIFYLEESTLFKQDMENLQEYLFSTADKNLAGSTGTTFWVVCEKDFNDSLEFRDFSAEVTKISGNSKAGYGLVFCQNENEKNEQSLLCVLINVNGFYSIGKLSENCFEKINEWTYSENLNTGYTSNLISVQKKEDKYQIYFNGNLETSFFDNKKILIPGGRGFVAVVSSEEKFPEQSVKIRYRIKK